MKKRNLAPYWLILPTLIYLAIFFAYPMVRGLTLAFFDDEALLTLQSEADSASSVAGRIHQGTALEILDRQGNLIPEGEGEGDNLLTELWYRVEGESVDGDVITGWTPESRIRVREEGEDGSPIAGTVRRKLGSNADPLTDVFAESSESSDVVGRMEASVEVKIVETATLEVWFLVRGEDAGNTVEGWAQSRFGPTVR